MFFRIVLTGMTLLLLTLVASVDAAAGSEPRGSSIAGLEEIRAYAAAAREGERSYAVDGGRLHVGVEGRWEPLATPGGVIVNAVAVDRLAPDNVYIGAANRVSVYVSRDGGESWRETRLGSDRVGGVTAVAFDAFNRLLYVGTDRDGVYRLRDTGGKTGQALVASGHLLLEEPVQEIAVDSTGAGMAFVRTLGTLYRAEAYGLRWLEVEGLPGGPTALAVANTSPPRVYVGTAGGGALVSEDGLAWRPVSVGLGDVEGGFLAISDLAVDPARPDVLYAAADAPVAGELGAVSSEVAMSTDGGRHWERLAELDGARVAELLPVSGRAGRVYALTTASRTALAVGEEPAREMPEAASVRATGQGRDGLLAWILAGNASTALIFLLLREARGAGRRRADSALGMRTAQAA